MFMSPNPFPSSLSIRHEKSKIAALREYKKRNKNTKSNQKQRVRLGKVTSSLLCMLMLVQMSSSSNASCSRGCSRGNSNGNIFLDPDHFINFYLFIEWGDSGGRWVRGRVERCWGSEKSSCWAWNCCNCVCGGSRWARGWIWNSGFDGCEDTTWCVGLSERSDCKTGGSIIA